MNLSLRYFDVDAASATHDFSLNFELAE